MIEVSNLREHEKVKPLPNEVQETIQAMLQILDTEYGADRNKYEDGGGYVIVVEEEHQKAIEKAEEVKRFLTKQGWSEPVVADSGNGAHLLYFIDLLNDKKSTELVKNVLKALDAMFTDNAVEVDRSTFNAARICKVYSTVACKCDDTEDRPHRIAKIISCPDEIVIVKKEQLQTIATMLPIEEKEVTGKKKAKLELKRMDGRA
ncbi:hypothetical protein D3C76_1241930 [compost metagenome]